MADKTIQYYDQGSNSIVPVKAKDNGDGTWTMYMANDHIGQTTDASASSDTGTFSLIALIKRLLSKLTAQLPAALGQGTMAQSLTVTVASNQSAVPVSGPVTNTELRASAVPVSGPVTNTELRASAVPISAASLPLPTGAATESTLSGASAKLPATLGQKAMSASLAVTVASDQSAVPTSNANNASFAAVANVSVTTTAAAVAGSAACRSVIVKAASTNTVDVLVGDATAQAFPLSAGQFVTIPTTNINTVYVKTASGTATAHVLRA